MIGAMLHSGGVSGLLLFWDLSVLSWGSYMKHSGFEKVHQCRKACYVKYLFIVVYMIYAVKSFLGNDTNRIELVFMTGANIIKLSSLDKSRDIYYLINAQSWIIANCPVSSSEKDRYQCII